MKFSVLSELCLLWSSKISLIIETPMTAARGNSITGVPFVIDIFGIICIKRMIRKYTLANFENYSIRFLGKNVSRVYFDVCMTLTL